MLDVDRLEFSYAGADKPAVQDLSFSIAVGDIFGLLGPSGAGKSTTQKILIGLLKGYRGEVKVLGRDLNRWGQDYYERVGVSFELPNHYLKLTARENLRYFRNLYGGETETPERVLESVGLLDDADKRVSEFSKGMKNRLNVARSLLNKPELLFLDEPTSGLDPVNAKRIKDLIFEKREAGTTVFLTTHNMNVADDLCDRVAFMVDGRITLVDSPRALKLAHGRRTVRVEYGLNGGLKGQDFALEGLGDNPAFLELLRCQSVQTLHTQETTLENIFIGVTGRTLT